VILGFESAARNAQFEKLVETVPHRKMLVRCVEDPVMHNASFQVSNKTLDSLANAAAPSMVSASSISVISRMEIRGILSRF
jgi:hypothetical protein